MNINKETKDHSEYYLLIKYLIDVFGPIIRSNASYPLWFTIFERDCNY